MKKSFEEKVDAILEQGHWKVWDGKEKIHMIADPKSWPKYSEMDKTGRPKHKKVKRIAGKI